MSDTLPLQLQPIAAELKSLYEETETTQLVLKRNQILWQYSRVLKLHPCSCFIIIVLNYFPHPFLDSLNKWGLPNQPSQSRRQPRFDLAKLGFADNLSLVAGLEEVSTTCCPHINLVDRCFYSSLGTRALTKRLTLTTTKIWGTSWIFAEQEISSLTRRSSIWSAVKCH